MANCDPISRISQCPNTIAIPISISPALTGYTRITEFTFTPKLTGDFATFYHKDISEVKVVWDFGDGYTLSADTPYEATHRYSYPGNYNITLYFYDNEGKALLNTLTQTLSIENFLSNRIKFIVDTKPTLIAGNLSTDANRKIPYNVQVTWQDYNSAGNTIYFAASGSSSDLYDNTYKYAFLLPFRAFYTYTNKFEKIENKQVVNLSPLYYVPVGGSQTPTLTTNPNPLSAAYILGATSNSDIYYYDDKPGPRRIFAAIDTYNHTIPDYFINEVNTNLNLSELNYKEAALDYIDVNVVRNRSTKLILTSTGNKYMTLPDYKRQGDKFQVFVAAGDADGNQHKVYSNFNYDNSGYDSGSINRFKVTIGTTSSNGVTSTAISSVSSIDFPYSSSLSSSNLSSFFYFNYTPTVTGTHVLSVSGKPTSDSGTLTGSYTFTVLPSAGSEYYKINELDFDYKETLKSYRFQDFLYEYDDLFEGVLGSIVGTLSSSPTTYGKATFEKVSNFVINNSDVDTCNISILKKLYDFLNEESNFNITPAPPELKRLYDLFTIRFRRLMGMDEKFDQSFDTFYSSNSAHAKNVDYNNPLSVTTYTVSAGQKFVAVQKFNNEAIIIEPMKVPVTTIDDGSTSAYPLSNFNLSANWGWPLDDTTSGTSLSAFYDFYPYIESYNNDRKNNILDYTELSHNILTKQLSSVSAWDTEVYKNIDLKVRGGLNL